MAPLAEASQATISKANAFYQMWITGDDPNHMLPKWLFECSHRELSDFIWTAKLMGADVQFVRFYEEIRSLRFSSVLNEKSIGARTL